MKKNFNQQAVSNTIMYLSELLDSSAGFEINKNRTGEPNDLIGKIVVKDAKLEMIDDHTKMQMEKVLGEHLGEITGNNGNIEIEIRDPFTVVQGKVFPSQENTIFVKTDKEYGGAHVYCFKGCLGFDKEKKTHNYVDSECYMQFVEKNDKGQVNVGVQSEQILYALIDRTKKLDSRFPDERNKKAIEGMQMAIDAFEERVSERIEREVMGDLKK